MPRTTSEIERDVELELDAEPALKRFHYQLKVEYSDHHDLFGVFAHCDWCRETFGLGDPPTLAVLEITGAIVDDMLPPGGAFAVYTVLAPHLVRSDEKVLEAKRRAVVALVADRLAARLPLVRCRCERSKRYA